ncbi:hypothetical protein LCGC14_2387130 [marine sediment metagenome]|uniref:Flagellar hook-associated protein FlgK helical domain-containing protein n=1 Tax=marine sediment metagenome TaxID=412755 RepID=A0A0F9ETY0_9ZZZZ
MLEGELLRLEPLLSQASQELLTLRSVESALGELGADGLMAAITRFFDSLQELAAQPDGRALQEQAIWAADTLARHFGDLGRSLRDLDQHLRVEGQDLVSQVNNLTSEIATLNGEVEHLTRRGGNPNLLLDRRDQAIAELSELMEVRVDQVADRAGVVNVVAFGTPLVVGNTATELEIGTVDDGGLGISVKDAGHYSADLSGGRLGGLFSLVNTILPEVRTKLDTLAGEIIHNINVYHVQGVGTAGDFTSITGWRVSDQALDTWDAWGTHLQAGTFYVGVTDGNDATTTRYAVSVAASDTAVTIAAKLDALDGLTATVADSALRIGVEDATRYSFEFLPAPITTLLGGWSGTAAPTASGVYTQQQDELFTFTVTAGGTLGQSQAVTVEIKNQANEVVGTLDLGLGYAVGDRLQITDELYVAFAAGTLTARPFGAGWGTAAAFGQMLRVGVALPSQNGGGVRVLQ